MATLILAVGKDVLAINPPVVNSPGNASDPGPSVSNLTPTFNWSGVSGASRYGLAISIYPYGSPNIVFVTSNISGSATSFNLPSGYLQND